MEKNCELIIIISGTLHGSSAFETHRVRTSMWHFAVLTRTDGKTGAVLLIVYEWLWMLEKNVVKVGLYG